MIKLPKFSRRMLLGGAGALLALPVLESAFPRAARAEGTTARRFLAFYVPNGMHMAAWTPQTTGPDYELSPILSPLQAMKHKVLLLSGVDNTPGKPIGTGGDHAAGTSAFLTCVQGKRDQSDIQLGISVDQVAAKKLGEATRIKSMQLGIEGGASGGTCDGGYSCSFLRNISWASKTQPLAKTVNPQVVFDQLFDGYDPGESAAEKERRRKYKKSVLDSVMDDAKSLKTRLGQADNRKLDEYMGGVYELEQRIAQATGGPECKAIGKPPEQLEFPEHVKLMLDLSVLAFQCDVTRVISFMLGNGGTNRTYEHIGVPDSHHLLSHHQDKKENIDKLVKIDTWEVAQLAYLLKRLDEIPEGDSSMLDNSVVYFGSECADGYNHKHVNIPMLIGGTAGGALKTGMHMKFDDQPPMANVFLTLLNALGVDANTFGDNGTGPMQSLKA